jgi:Cys-rich protein (TIGR01571 family)
MDPFSCKPCIKDLYPSMEARRLWQPSPDSNRQNYWSSGLFDCMLHVPSCAQGTVMPCLNLGQSSHFLDQNGFLVPFCASFGCFAADLRMRVRQRYSIKGNANFDLLATCLCLPCSSCQIYRETSFQYHSKMRSDEEEKRLRKEQEKHSSDDNKE